MSKPEIVTMDTVGFYNSHLEETSARLLKGGSWKKQRCVMVVPTAELIDARVYLNHCSIIAPPNQGFHRMLAVGQEVGDAYSNCIDAILANPELRGWEYLATVESDNLVPPDFLVRLMRRLEENPHLAAVSGLYWCKGEGGWTAPHIWGDVNDPVPNYRPQPPRPGELVECYGLSMGACLYRLSMFHDERLKRPFFQTKAGLEGVGTQDLSFWAMARPLGYRCAVDCSVPVGHLDYDGKFGEKGRVW